MVNFLFRFEAIKRVFKSYICRGFSHNPSIDSSVSHQGFWEHRKGCGGKWYNKYMQILKHRVKFNLPLEISREICQPVGSTGIISVRYQLLSFCWSVNIYIGVTRERKNCFTGFCVDEFLGKN